MISKSTRPYLVRAIWEWCSDNGYAPYIAVRVDENTRVPPEYVRGGEIILNIGADATHKLTLGNELIQFAARFGGVSRECSIPMAAVRGVFARENGEGIFFEPETGEGHYTGPQPSPSEAPPPTVRETPPEPPPGPSAPAPAPGKRPHLQVVK